MHAIEVHLITGSVNKDFLVLVAVPGPTIWTLHEFRFASVLDALMPFAEKD